MVERRGNVKMHVKTSKEGKESVCWVYGAWDEEIQRYGRDSQG
jgi:hypothetical protein